MTNEIQIFNNPDFREVRTISEAGAALFCGRDVAAALGYSNPRDALARHCRGVVKRDTPTESGTQEMSFIPESDLYRLVFSSKLPTAEKFTDWVTSEVLPTIRRHGAYMTPETIEKALTDPDTIIQLATTLKEERAARLALEAKAEADKPKVLFADAVSASRTSILVGELAKLYLPIVLDECVTATQKTYIMHYFVDRMNTTQIAKLYGVHTSTVSRTIRRGLDKAYPRQTGLFRSEPLKGC